MEKVAVQSTKGCNISETRQDRPKVSVAKLCHLEWSLSEIQVFLADLREIRFLFFCILSLWPCQLPRKVSNETNKCHAHSVSIEIFKYNGIARFVCDSTTFLFEQRNENEEEQCCKKLEAKHRLNHSIFLERLCSQVSDVTKWAFCEQNVRVSCTVWVKKIPPEVFCHFPQTVRNLWSNFTYLLYVPIYAGLQIFISNCDEVMPY